MLRLLMTLLRRLVGSRSARRTKQVLGLVLRSRQRLIFATSVEDDEDREGIADPPVLDRT